MDGNFQQELSMKFTIKGRLTSLNDYINVCRRNCYQANNLKRDNQKEVWIAIKQAKLKPIKNYPIKLNIKWYEPNSKRDIDNVCFGVKFILDELVNSKIIENDSQKYVSEINHIVKVDKENPRIEVEIREV